MDKLRIFPAARLDMRDCVEYIDTLSPDAALGLYGAIVEGIGALDRMPQRCGLLKTPELRAKGYRALPVKNYVAFFVITGNIVQIRRILYGGRKFEWLL
jgi:plasmid stabilization system protein ParE